MRILLAFLLLSLSPAEAGNRYANAFAVKIVQNGAARPSSLRFAAVNRLSAAMASQIGWANFYAVYPFIGPSATANNVNLIAPGTLTCVQTGTVTNSATGITGDGTSAFLDTGFNPSVTGASVSSLSITAYSRGPTPAGGITRIDIGSVGSDNINSVTLLGWMVAGTLEGGRVAGASTDIPLSVPASNTVHTGLQSVVVNGSRVASYYLNGSALSGTSTMGGAFANANLYILASNRATVGAQSFSLKNLAFVAIGTGRTAAQEARLYQIVEAYQVALGRGGF